MPDALVDWVNTRGPVILDRMYDMLPLMVVYAVSAALFVYWMVGRRPHGVDGGDANSERTGGREGPLESGR